MNKKHLTIAVIIIVTVICAAIAAIVYFSLKNEETIYLTDNNKMFIRTFPSPYEFTDDVSGNERVDIDGTTMYFKPGRNKIIKNREYINSENVKTSGWAIWGLQVRGLRYEAKYKMTVNIAIDSMPDDPEKIVAKINTHTVGIQDGHHICQTPNDNIMVIKASDFNNINEFKDISMEFVYNKFTAEDMIHNHKGNKWEEFNGLYHEGALELRVGWADQKTGIKIKGIKIERVE